MREELVGLLVCGADGVGVVDFLLVTCKAEQCFYLHYTVHYGSGIGPFE